MRKIRQVLLLRSQGKSYCAIARALPIHRRTCTHYSKLAERMLSESGQSWEQLLSGNDEELERLIAPPLEPSSSQRQEELQQRFEQMEKQLKKTGQTRWNLWVEYKQSHPGGYNYSQFCGHYRKWLKRREVVMIQEHKYGDKVYVDYAGETLSYRDPSSGEVLQAQVLVSVLGGSQYMHVEAQGSQQREDLMGGIANALYYFGGVPQALVTDNLKAAVLRSDRYEPEVQQEFADFCHHYGLAALPTRAYKPRDKALVENGVKLAYMWIYAPIGERIPVGLEALNQLIGQYLEGANGRQFQNRGYSRAQLFQEQEQPLLRPLPASSYEPKRMAQLRVHKTSHIQLRPDFHYYSVPYLYIGRDVRVYYTRRSVEIYYHGERIATHVRNRNPHGHTTLAEHLPSTHRFVAEWNPDKFLSLGAAISAEVQHYIAQVLAGKLHPDQANKSCAGILTLEKKYGKERLSQACRRAAHFHAFGYQALKRILAKNLDSVPLETEPPLTPLPGHDNIRGKSYYE